MYGGGGFPPGGGGYPPGPPGYPPGGGGYPPGGGGYPPAGQPMQPQGGFGAPPMYAPGGAPQGFGQPQFGQPQNAYGMVPHAPYGMDPMTGLPFSDKEKITAGLLQLFLGVFGAGRFYTGHTGMAIAQMLVSIFTCGIGSLWPFIDGIMMLSGQVRDDQGRPLR